MISFTIQGVPIPQGSKNLVRGRVIEANKRLKPWRKIVATEAQKHAPKEPINTAVQVAAVFAFQRPRTTKFPHYPAGKVGDIDKLCRAILDGLTTAGIYSDDSRVTTLNATKRWCEQGETPHAHITIQEEP